MNPELHVELSVEVLLAILAAGFFAGLIDAMVGGGGLIQVPVIFALFPNVHAATLMGTSKFAGMIGTGAAFWQYLKRMQMPWRTLLYGALGAASGALIGAYLLTKISNELFRTALPFLLLAVFLYTLKRKDFGQQHAPRFDADKEIKVSAGSSTLLGFYDGFFGPGTGSFFVFLFVRVFGFDFLHASAMAKGLNVACNVASLAFFIASGHIIWTVALALAVANLSGSLLGAKLAIHYGSTFVRKLFIVVVAALILKSLHTALFVN
jgi:uncharacterized protein